MRLLRNRVLVTVVTLTLITGTATTSQAGVVPWLWNVFFSPPNVPLFPRLQARRAALYGGGYGFASAAAGNGYSDCCNPSAGYASASYAPVAYAPSYEQTYGASYAPSYTYATPSYSSSYSDVVVGNSYYGGSYGVPMEYSGYVTNGCGATTSAYPVQGTVIDDRVIGSDPVSSGTTDPIPEYEAPPAATREDNNDRGVGTPRPRGGDGLDRTRPEPPVSDTPRSDYRFNDDKTDDKTDPWEAPIGSEAEPDFYKSNRPVSGDPADDVTPSGKAPMDPEARRPGREIITTVSLTGTLERDTLHRNTRVFTSALRHKKLQRTLRWISLPNEGRTALR